MSPTHCPFWPNFYSKNGSFSQHSDVARKHCWNSGKILDFQMIWKTEHSKVRSWHIGGSSHSGLESVGCTFIHVWRPLAGKCQQGRREAPLTGIVHTCGAVWTCHTLLSIATWVWPLPIAHCQQGLFCFMTAEATQVYRKGESNSLGCIGNPHNYSMDPWEHYMTLQ